MRMRFVASTMPLSTISNKGTQECSWYCLCFRAKLNPTELKKKTSPVNTEIKRQNRSELYQGMTTFRNDGV